MYLALMPEFLPKTKLKKSISKKSYNILNTKRLYLSGIIGDLLCKSLWNSVLTCGYPLAFKPKIPISESYHLLSIRNLLTFFWDRIFKLGLWQKFRHESEIRSFLEFIRRNQIPYHFFLNMLVGSVCVPHIYTGLAPVPWGSPNVASIYHLVLKVAVIFG